MAGRVGNPARGSPDLYPVRQPTRACLPLIGVEGGRQVLNLSYRSLIMADTTATAVRPSAHVITLAGRRAAPIITDTTDRDTIALHVAVENGLSAALGLLRSPDGTAADLERATARVCRAATLLRRLCAAQAQGGAA